MKPSRALLAAAAVVCFVGGLVLVVLAAVESPWYGAWATLGFGVLVAMVGAGLSEHGL